MHYKSRYPPPPPTPIINIHDLVFTSPAQPEPADKLQFVEPLAGRKWSRNEFRERVHDCATALVAPVADGGLGFAHEGEMVAVMSTNCVVSTVPPQHPSSVHSGRCAFPARGRGRARGDAGRVK